MALPPSSDGGARPTVRCVDCLFWIRDEKLRAHVCYFKSRVITRRAAGEGRECAAFVSHLEVCAVLAGEVDRRLSSEGDAD